MRRTLSVATWNVRSLIEDSGDKRICQKRPQPSSTSVGRKFDFLVHELRRYSLAIAAVQETKWFGSDVWTTKGYTLLHSGRGLPAGDAVARRTEGVGILLDPAMTQAWCRGGESWSTVSSRLVVVRLKIADAGESTVPGRRWTRRRDLFMTVVSA